MDSPAGVRIEFSESVLPAGRGIAVWSPSGRQVARNLRHPTKTSLTVAIDATESGTYLVSWSVIADDTHPSRGTSTFSVTTVSAVPRPAAVATGDVGAVSPAGLLLQTVGRWLHLAGYALGFGVLLFALAMLRRWPPDTALRWVALAGVALMIAAEPILLLGQVLSLGALDGQVAADALASSFGRILALRLGAALLLWALLGVAAQTRSLAGAVAVIALGAGVAIIDAASSHVVVGIPPLAGALLNACHQAAMGAWAGGLVGLAVLLRTGLPSEDLVRRFGRFAAASAAILVGTGLLLAVGHLRSAADLIGSVYGAVLVVKIAGVAVALLAAWFGLRTGRSWRGEAVALGGVMALAGLLVSLPPPR